MGNSKLGACAARYARAAARQAGFKALSIHFSFLRFRAGCEIPEVDSSETRLQGAPQGLLAVDSQLPKFECLKDS
jgi:hypothetical protein